jgi:uncharacterized pyridoxamine 5'-phosphate oxidase family protein
MNNQQITNFIEFIRSNRLVSFATIAADSGFPQLSYVYYIMNGEHQIFIATTENSRKIKNIKKNNKVALLIGSEVEPQVAQIEGVASVVSELELRLEILMRISTVANQNPNSLNMPPLVTLLKRSDLVIIKITIDKFKYSDFSTEESSIIEGILKDLV